MDVSGRRWTGKFDFCGDAFEGFVDLPDGIKYEGTGGIHYDSSWYDDGRFTLGGIYELRGRWARGDNLHLNGEGSCLFYSDDAKYEGHFVAGEFCGTGTLTIPNLLHYCGEWRDGKPHGRGRCTIFGKEEFDGLWQEGVPQDLTQILTACLDSLPLIQVEHKRKRPDTFNKDGEKKSRSSKASARRRIQDQPAIGTPSSTMISCAESLVQSFLSRYRGAKNKIADEHRRLEKILEDASSEFLEQS